MVILVRLWSFLYTQLYQYIIIMQSHDIIWFESPVAKTLAAWFVKLSNISDSICQVIPNHENSNSFIAAGNPNNI